MDIIKSLSQVLTNVARVRQEPKFDLKAFEGLSEERPSEFMTKYELLADAYGWEEKHKYFSLYLKNRALRWFTALPDTTKRSFRVIKQSFLTDLEKVRTHLLQI